MLLSNLYSTKTKKSTKYGAQSTHPDPPDPGGSYHRYRDEYTSSLSHHWLEKRERKAHSSPSRRKSTTRHHTVTTSSQHPPLATTSKRDRIHGPSRHSRHSKHAKYDGRPVPREERPPERQTRRHETTRSDTTTNHDGSSFWTTQPRMDPAVVRKCERERERIRIHAVEPVVERRGARNPEYPHSGGVSIRDGERVRKRVRFAVVEGMGREDDKFKGKYSNSTYYTSQQARKPEPAPPHSHSIHSTQNEPLTVCSGRTNAREPNEAHVRPSAPLVVAPAPSVADSTQNEPKSARSIQSNSHKPTRARTAPPIQPNVRICEHICVQVDLARSTIEKSHGGDSSPPHHEHKRVRFTTGEGGWNGAQGKYGLPPRTSNHHEK